MRLFDSHTHVQFSIFDEDRDEVIKRAFQNGVGFIVVGTQREMSQRAVKLAEQYSDKPIFAAVGLHPAHAQLNPYHDTNELDEPHNLPEGGEVFDDEYYLGLASNNKTVAIGECGLDYFRIKTQEQKNIKTRQKDTFLKQIRLAKEVEKPLMIHCRPSPDTQDAYEEICDILVSEVPKLSGVVMHFFAGNMQTAKRFIELGVYFTFGGVVTFTHDYDDIIRMIPENRLLIETDAPYLAPEPHRRERNEPAYVRFVLEQLAQVRGITAEKLAEQTTFNSEQVFGISVSQSG